MSELNAYFEPRKKAAFGSLPFITRPSVDGGFDVFTSGHDGFAAFIRRDVREAISHEAYRAAPNETIGLLAGRVLQDERGPYTLVLASEGALPDEVEATPSHVRISGFGQAQVRNRLESSAYGLDIIGWYHSHPRYRARFSSVDITEQSTWRDGNHLGIVISCSDASDPLGVYRGPQATLLTPANAGNTHYEDVVQQGASYATVISPPVQEHEEGPRTVVNSAAPTVAVRTSTPRLKSALRLLPILLTIVMLCMAVNLFRLESKMDSVEKRLMVAELDQDRAPSGRPAHAAVSTPAGEVTESAQPKETTADDKLMLAESPVTKVHPLLPVTPAPLASRSKPGKHPKPSGKKEAKIKPTAATGQTSPKKNGVTDSKRKGVKPGGAPENRPKSNAEDATDKPIKP